jgi:hypothetical protein
MHRLRTGLGVTMIALAAATAGGCASNENAEWELPDPVTVTGWFGEGTEASLDGNVLEIRGRMNPDHLRRGGRLWIRSGPYFYLFNIHIEQLMRDYPDVAAVRVRTFDDRGNEVARAMLHRSELSEIRWDEALARASLAQVEGTENPRLIERLVDFGEDHTEFEYRREE